jgi:hypothetical protein
VVSTSFGTFFRHLDFVVFGTPCKQHFLDYEIILSISAPNLSVSAQFRSFRHQLQPFRHQLQPFRHQLQPFRHPISIYRFIHVNLLSALLHRQAARGALTADGWSNPTRSWWLIDYPRQRRCGLIVFYLFRLTFVSVYFPSFV